MAVLEKAKLMEQIKELLKDNTSDEALAFVEDVSDTFDELHNKANGDGKDWKAEYEKNDAEWRQRYKDRFFSGSSNGDDANQNPPDPSTPPEHDDDDTQKQYKFENLFTAPDEKGVNNA